MEIEIQDSIHKKTLKMELETYQSSMNLLDIPAEVISHHLLKFLNVKELLGLRLVCKDLKNVTNDYIRLQVQSNKEIYISSTGGYVDEDDYENENLVKTISMSSLLEFGGPVPSSRFTLIFTELANIFENPEWDMEAFGDRFGKQITHLKMSTLTAPMTRRKENEFYEKLVNLKQLTIGSVDLSEQDIESYDDGAELTFPSTFKNLEHFIVKEYYVTDSQWTMKYFWKMINTAAPKLRSLCLPCYEDIGEAEQSGSDDEDDDEDKETEKAAASNSAKETFTKFCFRNLAEVVDIQRKLFPKKAQSLKYFDLQGFQSCVPIIPQEFADLCKTCEKFNVRLGNVPVHALFGLNIGELKTAANCIVSMKGVSFENLVLVNYPVLEKLSVRTRTATMVTDRDDEELELGDLASSSAWPVLTTLELTVNSELLNDLRSTVTFFHLIFCTKRPTLTELKLSFNDEHYDEELQKMVIEHVPVPRTRQIIYSCSNLRRLSIQNWLGTNKALSILWTGLPLLEELSFDECVSLGNVAFVGADTNSPTFLQLKNLKKLNFFGMELMPKITDTVFELVFRHMKLREFIIMSLVYKLKECVPKELKSITPKGIKALLTGDFAMTIEKFPFDCWALEGVPEEEFRSLRNEFRFSQLL